MQEAQLMAKKVLGAAVVGTLLCLLSCSTTGRNAGVSFFFLFYFFPADISLI